MIDTESQRFLNTWAGHRYCERMAQHYINLSNKSKDCLQRGYLLDEARKWAKKIGAEVEVVVR